MDMLSRGALFVALVGCSFPAAASPITLQSVYRNVEASSNYHGQIHRIESADAAHFDGYIYVDNSPSYVHARLWAHHVSDIELTDDTFSLSGVFETYVYWYWAQSQFYSHRIDLSFFLERSASYQYSTATSCTTWLGGCISRMPWWTIDGNYWDYGSSGSGILAAGEHHLTVELFEYGPWYGQFRVEVDFLLDMAEVPEPGSMALLATPLLALAGWTALRRTARSSGDKDSR